MYARLNRAKIRKDRLVFLTEYPIEMATLSEPCNSSLYGKRFELYIHGIKSQMDMVN